MPAFADMPLLQVTTPSPAACDVLDRGCCSGKMGYHTKDNSTAVTTVVFWSPSNAPIIQIYKTPLRVVPRGVAQERTEKHAACDRYYTHMISYYDVMKYLFCSTCGSMHVSHTSRDPEAYRSWDPVPNATKLLNTKPQQQYYADKLPHACGVAFCSAGRRQA